MMPLKNDVLCFSHLRWTFVFQRPQHLMSRFGRSQRVYFIEEPLFEGEIAHLRCSVCERSGVRVITPILPERTSRDRSASISRELIEAFVVKEGIYDFIAWYYTPMALEVTSGLTPELTVYDCMDELSAFANAPAAMLRHEQTLFKQCDLVFTGGQSLFDAKRSKHERVYLFPSSVDTAHFAQALTPHDDPEDQKWIPHPRIGYAGVIDERMDLQLIEYLGRRLTEWQVVLIGPIVKIDPQILPRGRNIHYLGMKSYEDLPAYLGGWDMAMLPFAQNEATRFISPTKTPEYLAAGLPVISTPIKDVIRPYGELGLVMIGRDHEGFVCGVEQQLSNCRTASWRSEAKAFLGQQSWDKTWDSMQQLVQRELIRKKRPKKVPEVVNGMILTSQVNAAHV